ncbi:hypothetical protein BDZ45DRAFT_717811 [Acephala macrosclerotiorum]|nr:hypothetical protein BDZ45DRAFT_717811 [Acephala macrosclerotiorum]
MGKHVLNLTNGITISTNTTPTAHSAADTLLSTILIFARDSASAYSAFSGLNATRSHTEFFGVRMVRLDVFPSAASGTTSLEGCCDDGVEQYVNITSTGEFRTSGLKIGAGVSTMGLWHYPASITNATVATEFAQIAPTTGFAKASTAGVINKIDGRQQMVFFTSFATDWSATSNFLQHAWIHWVTRNLYTDYRRVTLNTQVDDMFLESDIYSPNGTTYQITSADLAEHVTDWFIEVGHNGNGNIEDVEDVDDGNTCNPGSIEYDDQINTPLEFAKPIGTGTSLWPSTPATYPYAVTCTNLDALKVWWVEPASLNAFAYVSHTFTREDQDNATYFDCSREISWNQAWLTQVGIAAAVSFSLKGIIPLAITGLHNGDALRAWLDNGIVSVVGDNTRPVLMNSVNEMWLLISTVAENGYAGVQISPRWATSIYYNCQLPPCAVLEWINTSAGDGDWYTLLELEKQTNTRHLLGLHHDAFMSHQANLNYLTAPETELNGEMIRLVDWPIVSQKHDDMAAGLASRMARDGCTPQLTYKTNPTKQKITGITLTTTHNNCTALIPVTVSGNVTDTEGFTTEQLGSDPLTIWVKMSGSPVTFTLSEAVPF